LDLSSEGLDQVYGPAGEKVRSGSARPPFVDAADTPLPGRSLRRREVVVIAPRERLERDEGGIVLE
jgi:hypothetical protein